MPNLAEFLRLRDRLRIQARQFKTIRSCVVMNKDQGYCEANELRPPYHELVGRIQAKGGFNIA